MIMLRRRQIVLKEETQAEFYSTGQRVGASGGYDGRASAGVVRITKSGFSSIIASLKSLGVFHSPFLSSQLMG